MKKRIANGVQLLFMLASFIMLWIPCIKIQDVDLIRDLPIETHAVGIMIKGNAYALFAIYAIVALMCIISIIVKPQHRDGKIHIVMSIVLFFYAVSMVSVEVGKAVGDKWMIAESNFPTGLYLICLVIVVAISIAKRSTIITGLPSTKKSKNGKNDEVTQTVINNVQETTNADELKKFKDLLDSGAITQEEFDEKKKQLLGL